MLLFPRKVIFLNELNSKNFREQIRLLERKLGLLNKGDTCCSEISLAQCHALVEIGRSKSISLKELSNILGLDISTMSRTVDGLVKKDFVLRSPSRIDRRSINIELTENGLIIFENIEYKMENQFKKVFEKISCEDQFAALNGLNIIIDALSTSNFICIDDIDGNKYNKTK